ncbi:MAG TPA: Uma2 family endonuclease, partial [Cytophagales bacterium]
FAVYGDIINTDTVGHALHTQQKLSYAEYETLDRQAEDTRYEFADGEVRAMSGATLAHNQIVQNLSLLLRRDFRPKGCRVYTESVKLQAEAFRRYFYPDVMLTCSETDGAAQQLVREPVLLIEVLSDSTEKHDLGKKVDYSLPHPILVILSSCKS